MKKARRIAVVGATGMVGQEMLRVLSQRKVPVSELVPVASPRSAGKKLRWHDGHVEVRAIAPEVFEGVDIALFSAGGGTSKEWSPIAAEKGAVVIDNSSAWRMDPDVPLVVPEVNLDAGRNRPKGIIANPNCSTIQMVVALAPIHRRARIRRIVVSTYQAISGAGARAVQGFHAQAKSFFSDGTMNTEALKGQLAGNLLMHWSVDAATGYQEEELKMVQETRKILGDPELRVSPTAVRVPVETGHSESIAVQAERPLTVEEVRTWLAEAPGVEVMDDFANGIYPTPLDVAGRDPVLVGRIREDIGQPGGIQMWVVGDNLRKGAALNAVQIAEELFD